MHEIFLDNMSAEEVIAIIKKEVARMKSLGKKDTPFLANDDSKKNVFQSTDLLLREKQSFI